MLAAWTPVLEDFFVFLQTKQDHTASLLNSRALHDVTTASVSVCVCVLGYVSSLDMIQQTTKRERGPIQTFVSMQHFKVLYRKPLPHRLSYVVGSTLWKITRSARSRVLFTRCARATRSTRRTGVAKSDEI